MTIPHEPRPGTLYVGRFWIALARNGAGFIAKMSGRNTVAWTPDPRHARRFDDRADFVTTAEAFGIVAAGIKLIACTDEIRIGPKPKPDRGAPILGKPKRAKKKKGKADGQAALDGL